MRFELGIDGMVRGLLCNRWGCTAMQRVLVVDDDADNRELMEECLRSTCLVTLAENGAEALELLGRSRRKFDALVVDLDMPRMDGAALVRELQHREIDIPVLIISGRYDGRWQAQDVHAAFMSKPFEVDRLTEKVAQLAQGA